MQPFSPAQCTLGIEFGSTRIKAVLVGPDHAPLAQGDFTWENKLENGLWTYDDPAIWLPMPRWPPTSAPGTAPHSPPWAASAFRP